VGTANAFDAPARQSFVSENGYQEDLANAIALNSTVFNLGIVIGPTIAALVTHGLYRHGCFTNNAISFIAVLTALF
jgi:predicted MFS family arabinose efflux permease